MGKSGIPISTSRAASPKAGSTRRRCLSLERRDPRRALGAAASDPGTVNVTGHKLAPSALPLCDSGSVRAGKVELGGTCLALARARRVPRARRGSRILGRWQRASATE